MLGNQLGDEPNLCLKKWLEITKHPLKKWLFRVPGTFDGKGLSSSKGITMFFFRGSPTSCWIKFNKMCQIP